MAASAPRCNAPDASSHAVAAIPPAARRTTGGEHPVCAPYLHDVIPRVAGWARGGEQELPPDVSISAIAEFGSLIGDPARISMLVGLLSSRSMTATEMSAQAGVTPQTASGHIAKLTAAGLLEVERRGKHRLHRLASDDVAAIVRLLYTAGSKVAPRSRPATERTTDQVRLARSCGGHLAGQLAVELARCLTGGPARAAATLTDEGRAMLAAWGAPAEALVPAAACTHPCMDWSEQQPHLSGPVGRALLQQSLRIGWLKPTPGSCVLTITPAGFHGFRQRFGIEI